MVQNALPFLCRRILLHRHQVPQQIQAQGKVHTVQKIYQNIINDTANISTRKSPYRTEQKMYSNVITDTANTSTCMEQSILHSK
jgi:hypothetical protein